MFKKPTFTAKGNVNLMQTEEGLITILADEITFFSSLDDVDLHTPTPDHGVIVNEPMNQGDASPCDNCDGCRPADAFLVHVLAHGVDLSGDDHPDLVDREYMAAQANAHDSK